MDEKHLPIQDDVVAALADALVQRIGEPRYNLWFGHKTKFTWQDTLLVVGVPNHFYQTWLEKTFSDDLREAARLVAGITPHLRFVIDPELFQEARRQEAHQTSKIKKAAAATSNDSANETALGPPGDRAPREDKRVAKPGRRWRQLKDFVVGPCNRVAHAAAISVVEAPAQGPNPLVLHGPVGTGKTHLLEGIQAGLRTQHPTARICFVTAEEFTNRFVQAMRLGKLSQFRKQYRDAEILLFDDLHFLAGKPKTQEEFLHTLDILCRQGHQVVTTCDCHPRLTDQFSPELADRLVGGAVWGLTVPEEETRRDILRRKAAQMPGRHLPEPVIHYLAQQLRGNVRELEGALHTIVHYSRVTERPLDLPLVREAMGDFLRHAVRVCSLADVERALCATLRVEPAVLQSSRRDWRHSYPRMLGMYLARKHTGATYAEIGQRFGRRNHSTVVAAEKKVRQWLQTQAVISLGDRQVAVRDLVERIEQELLH